jgi:hypothetical protein
MSMDLSPADYVLRALPRSTAEFPVILFALVGIIGSGLAYATVFSEDGGVDVGDGAGFADFGLGDLGFSDSPRSGNSDSYSSSYGASSDSDRDDSYGFGFGSSDAKSDDDSYGSSNARGGGKSKRRPRSGRCSTSSRRRKPV